MNGDVYWVLHVDLDQFVAAVELLRRPELRGKPVIVGGDGDPSKRGVVSTASYVAREFGVRSGMALRIAARKCPDGVFLPVDAAAYDAASRVVMQTLRDTGADLQVLGWDEAFLGADIGDPEAFARDIQAKVLASTQLYCSVGIGENKLQAKMATDYGKPAGVFRLTHATWAEVLFGKPTDALWGIGSKTSKKLATIGITTVAALACADDALLAKTFGPNTGPWLRQIARGISESRVSTAPWIAKGRSKETTFQSDLNDWALVAEAVADLARQLSGDREVQRVVVKVRFAPFFTRTHGAKLASPALDEGPIVAAALAALDKFTSRDPVRLVGVRVEFS